MAYTLTTPGRIRFDLDDTNLKASLIASDGTIHASLRNVTTGFVMLDDENFLWTSASIPDAYQGAVVFHQGAIGTLDTDFAAAEIHCFGAINPQTEQNTHSTAERAAIGAAVWAVVINGSYDAGDCLLIAASGAGGGKIGGAMTPTVTIRDLADTTDLVVMTVSGGNRTAITITLP